jgi:hypothetical protein
MELVAKDLVEQVLEEATMPGPVSDSYDPEFGTLANAADVKEAVELQIERISEPLGPALRNIVEVVHGRPGRKFAVQLCEQDLRVIRFGLDRALDSL